MEGQGFQNLVPQYEQKGVKIFGISNDDAEANGRFAKDNGFSFPLLCDTSLEVAIAYGAARAGDAAAQRVAVLIDGEGRIEKYFATVDPSSFPRRLSHARCKSLLRDVWVDG